MPNKPAPEGDRDESDVAKDYDESRWTWPDWEPTPPAEGFFEAVMRWWANLWRPRE
jgi:hypothetical protein